MSDEQPTTLADLINEANAAFDTLVQQRHDAGAQKYGAFKFLGANTLEEAMQEILDLANYARYTYIKLYLMGVQLEEKYGADAPPGGFRPNEPSLKPSQPGLFGDK